MKVIGLTGGIASGKSTVSKILAEKYGLPVMDADIISRKVAEPGMPALEEIRSVFGKDCLTGEGEMDREKMGALIRKDPESKKALEMIIHHYVGLEVMACIERHQKKDTPLLVYDCPLLFEAGADEICDRTALVTLSYDQRLIRLMNRDGIDSQTALEKMAIQMSDEEKIALADDIIDNSGDIEHLLREVELAYQKWVRLE